MLLLRQRNGSSFQSFSRQSKVHRLRHKDTPWNNPKYNNIWLTQSLSSYVHRWGFILIASCSTLGGRLVGRLEQGHSMLVGMVVDMEEQEQLWEEEQALGRGMVVVVAGIPTRAAGFGRWREEELAEGEQAWLEPEDPCGGHGGGGCG